MSIALKVGGAILRLGWEIFMFSQSKRHVHSFFSLPDPSSEVVRNPNWTLYVKDIGFDSLKYHKAASTLSIYLDPIATLSWWFWGFLFSRIPQPLWELLSSRYFILSKD